MSVLRSLDLYEPFRDECVESQRELVHRPLSPQRSGSVDYDALGYHFAVGAESTAPQARKLPVLLRSLLWKYGGGRHGWCLRAGLESGHSLDWRDRRWPHARLRYSWRHLLVGFDTLPTEQCLHDALDRREQLRDVRERLHKRVFLPRRLLHPATTTSTARLYVPQALVRRLLR